jgi:hypothetical protein
MSEDIPQLRPPDQMPPVLTQADLFDHWRALMGPLGFSDRSLWLMLLRPDGRCDGLLTKIEQVPARPDRLLLDNLMGILDELLRGEPGVRLAFLLSRPGRDGVTPNDRAWGRDLHRAARAARLPCEPVHVANDVRLHVLAMDDLTDPAAAA